MAYSFPGRRCLLEGLCEVRRARPEHVRRMAEWAKLSGCNIDVSARGRPGRDPCIPRSLRPLRAGQYRTRALDDSLAKQVRIQHVSSESPQVFRLCLVSSSTTAPRPLHDARKQARIQRSRPRSASLARSPRPSDANTVHLVINRDPENRLTETAPRSRHSQPFNRSSSRKE